MDLGLKNKLIVVTGGGAGIGAGISRACLAEGARVVVLGRRSENVQAFLAEMEAASALQSGGSPSRRHGPLPVGHCRN